MQELLHFIFVCVWQRTHISALTTASSYLDLGGILLKGRPIFSLANDGTAGVPPGCYVGVFICVAFYLRL